MARNYPITAGTRTGIAVADSAVPAAPEDTSRSMVSPPPPGVYQTSGASMLRIDVAAPSTTTGNYVLNVYAWNTILRQWVSEGQATVSAAAVGDFSGRLFGRAIVTNWCSDYVAVMIQTMATNGGSGVGTSISVTNCVQQGR